MRILVISNFYPPHYIGGYELGCRDVVEGLNARGHEAKVLTSIYGIGRPESDREIYRLLQADLGWQSRGFAKLTKLLRKEVSNQMAFKRLCVTFSPEVIYAWNLTHVSISLAFMAQRMGLPVCYFVFDNWLSLWESDSWYSMWNRKPRRVLSRVVKLLFRPVLNMLGLLPSSSSLDMHHVQFASQYLKQFALQVGKPVTDGKVIHWGIDVNQYPYNKKVSLNPKRLLYVGQIVRHKGIHTLVEALNLIVQQHGYESSMLTIVGGTIIPDYELYIRRLVSSLGLASNVCFTGLIQREHLPYIYQEHDILIFPSTWDEPFGIVQLEAMASGLAIVGTATGGSAEILQDEVNALVFPKEDAKACAAQIIRLMSDSELFERIRQNGRRSAEDKFNFESMMDKIENSLYKIVA